ncbi:MAG: 16S rRNA (guanine(966)-N(2))-methyltransferase RsmD [Actinobacteria bacterium]|nr:16S rRNA (guanine(966)-N(2))-methyltransferase RsmD [Actinomycetota bacterium]
MTRIIAGAAGGTRLEVPGHGTRPTSDRVRESLFAALESMDVIAGARALDLYAGSGALGLEALSRGARSAVLVERGRPAAAVARRNVAAVAKALAASGSDGASSAATVQESSVQAFLARAAGPFDLVFTDPPYDLSDVEMTADLIAVAPLLSPDAVVVIERAKRSTPPDLAAAGLSPIREKVYGDTALWWAEPAA